MTKSKHHELLHLISDTRDTQRERQTAAKTVLCIYQYFKVLQGHMYMQNLCKCMQIYAKTNGSPFTTASTLHKFNTLFKPETYHQKIWPKF